jgi:hypothetical protein
MAPCENFYSHPDQEALRLAEGWKESRLGFDRSCFFCTLTTPRVKLFGITCADFYVWGSAFVRVPVISSPVSNLEATLLEHNLTQIVELKDIDKVFASLNLEPEQRYGDFLCSHYGSPKPGLRIARESGQYFHTWRDVPLVGSLPLSVAGFANVFNNTFGDQRIRISPLTLEEIKHQSP